MGQAKILFQKDDELCKMWSGVAHQTWFDRVVAMTRAEVSESAHWSAEQWNAVNLFIGTLTTICDVEEDKLPQMKPILNHDLDVKPRKKE